MPTTFNQCPCGSLWCTEPGCDAVAVSPVDALDVLEWTPLGVVGDALNEQCRAPDGDTEMGVLRLVYQHRFVALIRLSDTCPRLAQLLVEREPRKVQAQYPPGPFVEKVARLQGHRPAVSVPDPLYAYDLLSGLDP